MQIKLSTNGSVISWTAQTGTLSIRQQQTMKTLSASANLRSSATPGVMTDKTVRRRLAPEVRVRQILDAARIEFLEHGFAATSIDNIAARCGLSKGGFYSHFASKQVLFEALVTRALTPPDLSDMPDFSQAPDSHALATWLVDQFHAVLGQPDTIAMLRLLIAENERAAQLLLRWQHEVFQPYLEQLGALLAWRRRGDQQGLLAQQPWLVLSPLVHAMVSRMLFSGSDYAISAERYRQAHVALLVVLLEQ